LTASPTVQTQNHPVAGRAFDQVLLNWIESPHCGKENPAARIENVIHAARPRLPPPGGCKNMKTGGYMKNQPSLRNGFFPLLSFLIVLFAANNSGSQSAVRGETMASKCVLNRPLKLTILYDNYPANPALKTDWGFACLIEGAGKTILFDTGGNGAVLLSNAEILGADLSKVEAVVLSHNHGDHNGGIDEILGMAPGIPVYVPESAYLSLRDGIEAAGGSAVKVREPVRLCEGVFTGGEIRGPVNEQCLVLDTKKGLVVVTGCSHPGIDRMLQAVQSRFKRPIRLVFGGFHMLQQSETDLNGMMDKLSELNVERWGPTHCTGDAAIQRFHDRFGGRVEKMGAGRIIEIE
jgi:7,8-dihydropterin-6-yl-methyl-4-(beta-D-ribofuranosyl)aminobenzene 5'-phosphate synthase